MPGRKAMTREQLNELKRLHFGGAPAPWRACPVREAFPESKIDPRMWVCVHDRKPMWEQGPADATLKAAARNALPELLAYIDALETEVLNQRRIFNDHVDSHRLKYSEHELKVVGVKGLPLGVTVE
jgi:hypothetical protein